jgi:hypothetical protein
LWRRQAHYNGSVTGSDKKPAAVCQTSSAISVLDEADNVIETQEQAGAFKEW